MSNVQRVEVKRVFLYSLVISIVLSAILGILAILANTWGWFQVRVLLTTVTISANGTSNGIIWAIDHGSNQLRAYNAADLSKELFTVALSSTIKFNVPTVADGEVFVPTSNSLILFGGAPAAASNLSATAISATEIDLTWTRNSTDESGFKIMRSTDNVTFTLVTTA